MADREDKTPHNKRAAAAKRKASHLHLVEHAIDEVFGKLAAALSTGEVSSRLKGLVAHYGFKRLN